MLSSRPLRSLVAVSLIGLLLAIVMHTSKPLQASTSGAPLVTVVNTSANPVPVKGSVTGTITGSVSISNTPSINIANTPSVALSGTPTINVGTMPAVTLNGTSDVNIVGGTVNTKPSLASRRALYVGSVNHGEGQDFGDFPNGPIKVSTIVVNSDNDITIFLLTVIQPEGNQPATGMTLSVPGGSAKVVSFQVPVEVKGLAAHNGALLAQANFTVDVIGN